MMMISSIFFLLVVAKQVTLVKLNERFLPCSAEIRCPSRSRPSPLVVEGFPGVVGPPGLSGPMGPMGPQGLMGPPGRDGFSPRPISFYAELRESISTKYQDRIIYPWFLSELSNVPESLKYFSQDLGIFIAPEDGLYQFFLTIAVSQSQAVVYITKNDQRICNVWVESIVKYENQTVASGWATGSIDCISILNSGDRISVLAEYRSNEHFNSYIYGYSYSTFSGYMLHAL